MKKIILTLILIHCALPAAKSQWIQQQSGVTTPVINKSLKIVFAHLL